MEKAIKRYWPVFVLPTLIAFIIGFVWPFIWGTCLLYTSRLNERVFFAFMVVFLLKKTS